ncbi:plasmid mobilization protein [Burkholderia cepacia]|uniref:plasmid mobilization protein n=1 Tax=Burkholderia cepacia TaxID=292 RepID=UPI003855FBA6
MRVWCLPEEKALTEANARDRGLSVSRYLRNIVWATRLRVSLTLTSFCSQQRSTATEAMADKQ